MRCALEEEAERGMVIERNERQSGRQTIKGAGAHRFVPLPPFTQNVVIMCT